MKTNPRFSTRLPLLLSVSCIAAGSLSSCKDPEFEATRQRWQDRNEMAELRKQHRAELQALTERIAALEAGNQDLADQLQAIPLPPPPEEMVQDPSTLTAEAPANEEDDDLASRDRRKIGAYQQKGLTGVPAEISGEIIRRARRDTRSWAAVDEIEAQAEGYRTVQSFATTEGKMLREERDELVFAVNRQHPNDWAAMAREIQAQTDAWKVLEEWKAKGVPGLKSWESEAVLYSAAESYPYDWSSALTSVAELSQKEVFARRSASAGK